VGRTERPPKSKRTRNPRKEEAREKGAHRGTPTEGWCLQKELSRVCEPFLCIFVKYNSLSIIIFLLEGDYNHPRFFLSSPPAPPYICGTMTILRDFLPTAEKQRNFPFVTALRTGACAFKNIHSQ
jgi:hypothetical protein